MVFIPVKESDYLKLSCTTRKSGSRSSRGAAHFAIERGLSVAKKKVAEILPRITEEYSNTRLVYVCK